MSRPPGVITILLVGSAALVAAEPWTDYYARHVRPFLPHAGEIDYVVPASGVTAPPAVYASGGA